MKNLAYLIVGIAAGFFVAHKVNQTSRGRRFLAEIDGRMREFSDTVAGAYKEREAELREDLAEGLEDVAEHLDDVADAVKK